MTDKGSCTIALEEEFKDYFNRNVLLPMAEFSYESVRSRFTFLPRELFRRGWNSIRFRISNPCWENSRKGSKAVPDLAIASSAATNLELTHQDAQKGKALAGYAAMRNIGWNEIMAVGDSENDTIPCCPWTLSTRWPWGMPWNVSKRPPNARRVPTARTGWHTLLRTWCLRRSCRNLGSI